MPVRGPMGNFRRRVSSSHEPPGLLRCGWRNWISSNNRTTPRLTDWAASPRATRRSVRSKVRSPWSANPSAGAAFVRA